jgi:hypothetical protein
MALGGAFSNVANGGVLVLGTGEMCQVNYGPGSAFDPNSVVLSNFVLPEPGAGSLGMMGAALLLGRWRRREKRGGSRPKSSSAFLA